MNKKVLAAIVVVALIILASVAWVMVSGSGDEGLEQVDTFADLTSGQQGFLEDHGFVVVDGSSLGYDTFQEAYYDMTEEDVPVVVTTDCMLHQYHVFFDNALKTIEEEELFDLHLNMSQRLMDNAELQYLEITDPWLANLSERLVAFFAVPLRLAEHDADVPDHVEGLVAQELALIEAHSGMAASPVFPGAHEEDYSQYVPRGHYTRTETLERYFKGMMWYGRQTFYNMSLDETAMAVLAVIAMYERDTDWVYPFEPWDRIYQVTELFVGESDDLMPREYLLDVRDLFGEGGEGYCHVANGTRLEEFRLRVGEMRSPSILSTRLMEGEDIGQVTKGLRIMGQRWIPDSYMFQNLVHDEVQGRSFPSGMDVLNVLGVERAEELMADTSDQYPDYDPQIAKLHAEFEDLPQGEWDANLYMGWMDTLTVLHQDFEGDDDYPEFMRDPAWRTLKVNTHLGSWTELRHDTILYAKQSYTKETSAPGFQKVIDERGYVEPIKGFYPRLIDLTRDTQERLGEIEVLSDEMEGQFSYMLTVLDRLEKMVDRELSGDGLTDNDFSWLRGFHSELTRMTGDFDDDDKKTLLVADVHTDTQSGQVLEEGVGYVDFLVIKVKGGDGEWRYCVGPVFSYYEFEHPMSDRLTDEAWTDMLEAGDAPDRPKWTEDFLR